MPQGLRGTARGPVALGNGLFCFVEKPVYLALESFASHYEGIVILGQLFVH